MVREGFKKMKTKSKVYWIIGFVLLLGLSIFTASQVGFLSVIFEPQEEMLDATCDVPKDCYNTLLADGFPKTELDNQLEDFELFCRNNQCGVRPK